jgi:hypothetical protein
VFDGERWAKSESGSRATSVSPVMEVKLICVSFQVSDRRPFKENASAVSGGRFCVLVGSSVLASTVSIEGWRHKCVVNLLASNGHVVVCDSATSSFFIQEEI